MGKFGLGVQNEAGQRLIEFCQETTLIIANITVQKHQFFGAQPSLWSNTHIHT